MPEVNCTIVDVVNRENISIVMSRQRITVKTLLSRYAAGVRNFTEIEIVGFGIEPMNLGGAYLGGADFRGSKWDPDTLFNKVNLSGANLSGVDFSMASFSDANFRNSNLSNCCFLRSGLDGVDLRQANLSGADLRQTNFYGADLREANLTKVKLMETEFYEAILTRATIDNDVFWDDCRFKNTVMPDGSIRNGV